MKQAGDEMDAVLCASLEKIDNDAVEIMRGNGIGILTITPEMAAELQAKTSNVADAWAERLEGMNLPGRAVLDAFKAELAKK